jgi:hypothetical protein
MMNRLWIRGNHAIEKQMIKTTLNSWTLVFISANALAKLMAKLALHLSIWDSAQSE